MTTSALGDPVTVRLTIPARAEYITLCRLALTGIARLREFSDELLADLKLALTEAASNSVPHAYGDADVGVVQISYELFPDRLVIEVVDEGEGFDPVAAQTTRTTLRRRPRDRDHPRDRGRGRDRRPAGGKGSRLRFEKALN